MNDDLRERDARQDVRSSSGTVDLYWIPLGAAAHVVRISGELFEAASALLQRRDRCDLYHSALVIHVPEGQFVIEQTPVPDAHGERRGVVAEGAVGTSCEMWNSNSVIAWALARGGADIAMVRPPRHGRAPGWNAGRVVAARAIETEGSSHAVQPHARA